MSYIMLYKKAIVAFIFKKDKKEDLGTLGWSASPQSLGR